MTDYIKREDAIKAIAEYTKDCFGTFEDALLNAEDIVLESVPSIDIVRCKECKWHHYDTDDECRWRIEEIPKDDDFCSRGERRE